MSLTAVLIRAPWDGHWRAGAYYDAKYGDPAGSVALNGSNASATQTVNGLTVGTTYIVSGNYQGTIGGFLPVPSFEAAMNGNVLFELATPADDNWDNFSFLYTASSSDATLSINAFNGTAPGYLIDNISMQAVPEPSALALIPFGGGVFYAYKRKRKRLCF